MISLIAPILSMLTSERTLLFATQPGHVHGIIVTARRHPGSINADVFSVHLPFDGRRHVDEALGTLWVHLVDVHGYRKSSANAAQR